MGVADGRDLVDVRAVSVGEERLQDRLGLVPGRAVVLDPEVAEAVELGEELRRPTTRRARSRRRPRAGGARRSRGGGPRPGGRSGRSGSGRAPPARVMHRAAEAPPNLPLQASSTRRSSRSPPAAGSRTGASIRAPSGLEFEALDGAAADPERRLAVAHPEQVDPLAGPLLGDGRLHPKPVRRPQRPEPLAQLGVAVLELVGLLGATRSTGPATRSESGSRTSAWIKSRMRSPTWAIRSRVYRGWRCTARATLDGGWSSGSELGDPHRAPARPSQQVKAAAAARTRRRPPVPTTGAAASGRRSATSARP